MDAELGLREKLLAFCTSKRYDDEVARAFDMFWGGRRKLIGARLDEADSARFIEWYIFDYKTEKHGKTPVALFEEFRGYTLPDDQRGLLRQWQRTRFGLFEVAGAWKTQLGLRDVFQNDIFNVQCPQGCPLATGDIFFSRILDVGNISTISGTITRIPSAMKEAVTQHLSGLFDEYARTVRGGQWATFFRDRGDRVNHYITDLRDGRGV
jgi:hypothetical protein